MIPYTYCKNRSGDLEDGAYTVTNFIGEFTTPIEFDNLLSTMPNYKIEYGGRCGWNALGAAASRCNVKLVTHIVQKYGTHLLHLGNGFGWTPLYCAANSENGYEVAKELVRLGSNVNISTAHSCGDSDKGSTYAGSTPLWAAIEKTKNQELIKLLLEHGAIVNPNLSAEGQKLLELVERQIQEEILDDEVLEDPKIVINI